MTAKMLKWVPGMDRDDMYGSLQLSCRVTNLLARFYTYRCCLALQLLQPISSRELHPLQFTINLLPATLPQEPFPCLLPPHAFPRMNPPLLQPLTNHLFQVLPNPLHLDIIDPELLQSALPAPFRCQVDDRVHDNVICGIEL